MDLASTYTVFFNTNTPDDHDNSLHLRTNNGVILNCFMLFR